MMENSKNIVYMQSYSLAKQYTKGFFAALPPNSKMITPDVFDAFQAALFNTFVDGYNQGAKDMELARAKEEYEKK